MIEFQNTVIQKAQVRTQKRPLGIGPQTGHLSERPRPRWGRRNSDLPGGVSVM
jgi:hypothetical protein